MKSKQVFKIMKILSWVIFIGLCIKTGVFIVSILITLFGDPYAANHLYMPVDVGSLYHFDNWYYLSTTSLVIIFLLLKAYIFYLVIRVFSEFNFNNPFNLKAACLISKISYVALGTGLLLVLASAYKVFLVKEAFMFPFDFGAAEFIFMAGVLFIIAFLFKRGVELQQENDLTI